MKITTCISYCTYDFRCLKKCIEEAQFFSDYILILVCDHFFDGLKENELLLLHSYQQNLSVRFIEYSYLKDRLYSNLVEAHPQDLNWSLYWHSTSKYISYYMAPQETQYFLFLDVDEIVEGKKFAKWLETKEYQKYDAMRLSCYLYCRESCYQATCFQSLPLWVKKEALEPTQILSPGDRAGIFVRIQGPKIENVSFKGLPLVHHYSWVKTKEECLRKTKCWGHRKENDWEALIEAAFQQPFQGKDFAYGFSYQKVKSFFDPLSVKIPKDPVGTTDFDHVQKVDSDVIFKKELSYYFGL